MGAAAVAGRTEVDRRGALGATNPLTAVRHTMKKARNFIIAVEGGVWCLREGGRHGGKKRTELLGCFSKSQLGSWLKFERLRLCRDWYAGVPGFRSWEYDTPHNFLFPADRLSRGFSTASALWESPRRALDSWYVSSRTGSVTYISRGTRTLNTLQAEQKRKTPAVVPYK